MQHINFFEQKIHIDIMIHRQDTAMVSYKGKSLCLGTREACMAKIRQITSELDEMGGRELVFNITNLYADPIDAGITKRYFKSHLLMLNSNSKSAISLVGAFDTTI